MATPTEKPNTHFMCFGRFEWLGLSVLVITAVFLAFPRFLGSNDDPSYSLAVCFISLAVVVGISKYAGEREKRMQCKEMQLILAAKKYAAGEITLDEYGAQTKEMLNDQ